MKHLKNPFLSDGTKSLIIEKRNKLMEQTGQFVDIPLIDLQLLITCKGDISINKNVGIGIVLLISVVLSALFSSSNSHESLSKPMTIEQEDAIEDHKIHANQKKSI